ncbi:MAG: protein kinase [Candidatus Brocadiae bacterium]|nr:protein kinase [Candidatus Brocadiia bacterium]
MNTQMILQIRDYAQVAAYTGTLIKGLLTFLENKMIKIAFWKEQQELSQSLRKILEVQEYWNQWTLWLCSYANAKSNTEYISDTPFQEWINNYTLEGNNIVDLAVNLVSLMSECLEIQSSDKTFSIISYAVDIIKKFADLCSQHHSDEELFSYFLLEKGIISTQNLENINVIHSTVNLKIGQIALRLGLMLQEHIDKIVKVQSKIKKKFGELSLQMGFLNKEQLETIIHFQKSRHISIKEILILENILSVEEVQTQWELLSFLSTHSSPVEYNIEMDCSIWKSQTLEFLEKFKSFLLQHGLPMFEIDRSFLPFHRLIQNVYQQTNPIFFTIWTELAAKGYFLEQEKNKIDFFLEQSEAFSALKQSEKDKLREICRFLSKNKKSQEIANSLKDKHLPSATESFLSKISPSVIRTNSLKTTKRNLAFNPSVRGGNNMVGKEFGDFIVTDLIGIGGMSEVYLAYQKSLERNVALKIISHSFDSNNFLERAIREAKIAAAIQHPNIVSIYSIGQEKDFFYIAMEYVTGLSLKNMIEKDAMPETFVWQIALSLCYALLTALHHEVIHRDIKPANVLITSNNLVKLTDFGLSKKFNDPNSLTKAGSIIGTPHYISPEQGSGVEVDFRSDIYSLGATIYHLLTKNTMFNTDNIVTTLFNHKFEPVMHPRVYVPTLSDSTCAVLAKMIQKQPKDRYQSYSNLIVDIMSLLNNQPIYHAEILDNYQIYCFENQRSRTWKFAQSNSFLQSYSKKVLIISKSLWAYQIHRNIDSFKVSLVTNPEEMIACLQNEYSTIILDSNTLSYFIVNFLSILKNKFPESLVLVCINKEAGSSDLKPFMSLPDTQDSKCLAEILQNSVEKACFKAYDITLSHILELAKLGHWDAKLAIDKYNQEEGLLIFRNGEVVEAFKNSEKNEKILEEQDALESLLDSAKSWEVENELSKLYLISQVDRINDDNQIDTIQYHVNNESSEELHSEPYSEINMTTEKKSPLLQSLNQPNILIVEDDKVSQCILSALLQKKDYQVRIEDDGASALFAIAQNSFDLIISDISMPNLDGFKLLEILKQKNILTPVIFITSSSQEQDEIKALELGVVDYIKKPIQANIMLMRVKNALQQKHGNKIF